MPRSLISLFERKLNCPVSTLGSKWASMAENEKDEIKEWLEGKYEIFAVLGPLEREVKFGDITLEGSNATFVHSGGFDTVQCHYYRQGYILSRPELPCMTENGGMKALRHPHLNFFPLEILEARSRKKNLKNDTNLKDNSKKLPPGMNRKLGGKDSKKISSGNKNEKLTEPESLAQLAKNKKVEAVGSESDLRCSVSKARPNKKRSRSLSPSNSSPRKKRTKTDKVKCENETMQKTEDEKEHEREHKMDLDGHRCSRTVQRALELCDKAISMLIEEKVRLLNHFQ